jgi:hypothetical protein
VTVRRENGSNSRTITCRLRVGSTDIAGSDASVSVSGSGSSDYTVSLPSGSYWVAASAGTQTVAVRCWRSSGSGDTEYRAPRSLAGFVAKS